MSIKILLLAPDLLTINITMLLAQLPTVLAKAAPKVVVLRQQDVTTPQQISLTLFFTCL